MPGHCIRNVYARRIPRQPFTKARLPWVVPRAAYSCLQTTFVWGPAWVVLRESAEGLCGWPALAAGDRAGWTGSYRQTSDPAPLPSGGKSLPSLFNAGIQQLLLHRVSMNTK